MRQLAYAPGRRHRSVALFNRINPDDAKSGYSNVTGPLRVYDTWSLHYENDGIDQNVACAR